MLLDGWHSSLLRASILVGDPGHEGVRVFLIFIDGSLLHSLDLMMELFDEFQFFVSDLVLLREFIKLMLKAPNSDLEELVFTLAIHGAVGIEFVLFLLTLKLPLPVLDLIA